MHFYIGLHNVVDASKFERCMISVNRLKTRKKPVESKNWIMDSGAFTQIADHGEHLMTIVEYAERVNVLQPGIAVCQDWMCEPFMLDITGKTVKEHQQLTIANYTGLLKYTNVPVMPVLQGYKPYEYVEHLKMYGSLLRNGQWVGVGSVCKRNSHPSSIYSVLHAIKHRRPDLRLHGFGIKTTSLSYDYIRDNLYSADSMSWSFAARRQIGNAHCTDFAKRYVENIKNQSIQTSMQLPQKENT